MERDAKKEQHAASSVLKEKAVAWRRSDPQDPE